MSQTSWCTTILTLVATITINYTITTIQTGDGVMVIIAYGLNGVMSTQQCVWERRKSGHCLIVVILGNWSLTDGGEGCLVYSGVLRSHILGAQSYRCCFNEGLSKH